jgi:hypothetical protein
MGSVEPLTEHNIAEVIDSIYDPESGFVTYRIFVPPGVDVPTGIAISFVDPVVMQQPDGARIVEVVGVPERMLLIGG